MGLDEKSRRYGPRGGGGVLTQTIVVIPAIGTLLSARSVIWGA